MIKSWLGIMALAILLASCNSSSPSQESQDQQQATELDPAEAFILFSKNFRTVTLPYLVPAPDTGAAMAEINREYISALFAQKSFKPAVEDNDVPDLAANIQSANYFYEGMWQTDGFQAFLIQKKDEDNYWYLSTFSKEGQFIDGICVGFRIGDEREGTERRAEIRDDQSLHIRQVEMGNQDSPEGPSRMFEITPDGRIMPLDKGKQPV